MNTPDLSIIIPIYNVEKYIAECINTILDLPKSIMTECILVDDCGHDRSMEIASEIIHNYSEQIEFQIIHHECNKGLSSARNTGLHVARGKYVFFFDSDDFICPSGLYKLIETALDIKADIIVGDYVEFNEGTDVKSGILKNIDAGKTTTYTGERFFELYHRPLTSVVWRNLFRREFLIENNIMFHDGVYFEDLEFTPIVFYKAKTVIYTGTLFYYYRKRHNSITTTTVSEKKVTDLILIWAELDKYVRKMSNKKLKSIFTDIGAISFLRQYKLYGKPLKQKHWLRIKSFDSIHVSATKYKVFFILFNYLPQRLTLRLIEKYSHL